MVKIKEIRKLSKEIKEIPKEKKIESIDDEFEEESEINNNMSFSIRRSNKTSTLEASNEKQDTFEERQERISKEDMAEMRFRPSYTGGGNPYKANSYTPVGSAESSEKTRDLGERGLGGDRATVDNNPNQNNSERSYAGEDGDRKDRRRNLM